ncbi:MAG: hydrogenase expression/formation protein HypE [Archaeoglobi archaeon]|nr:hydrogenase expression/formation protein HypE [Candidatus Mnemosynella sp.]
MKVSMIHGAGGEAMNELLRELLSELSSKSSKDVYGLEGMDDGAVIDLNGSKLVFTTDSHAVDPIFFPGGDIGKLSICGTANDLAVMGARPLFFSNSMVIGEGFEVEELKRIMRSMDEVLRELGAVLVTGDTKVIEREALRGLIINTSGIGIAERPIYDSGLKPGDKIIVSGTIGDHGLCILCHREGFEFETPIFSDVSPVWEVVERALRTGGVTAMKDPTRGGLAAALNEMASKSGVRIEIDEELIPIKESVRSASEMLGIDPLEVANEGKVVMGVQKDKAEEVLEEIRKTKYGKDAMIIGEVKEGSKVIMRTKVGGRRIVDMPLGDPIPRVC